MAYVDYANELMGYVPKVSFLLAQKAVNRAWRDIRDARLWSWQIVDDVMIMPQVVSAGFAAVTQFSTQVTANAAAKAVWDVLGLTPPITQRQFRVNNGPIYSIVAYDNAAGIATLNRKYVEATAAAASYSLYQCYYAAPVKDFVRWKSVYDPITPRRFKLRKTMRELNMVDPQRQNFGTAYALVPYKVDALATSSTFGFPMFEAWPHPQTLIGVNVLYQRKGADFVAPTDALPAGIPDELLFYKARQRMYEWAEANKGRFPELRAGNWAFLMGQAEAEYKMMLQTVKLKDEESFSEDFIEFDDGDSFGIDAKYMQSHDVDNWWG